jgi:hypothetical protein
MSVDKSLVESGDDIERAAAETDLSLINPPDRSRVNINLDVHRW